MTEEQRRQAAAQRCADLANGLPDAAYYKASHSSYVPTDFTEASGVNKALLNIVLQLDELARPIVANPRGVFTSELVQKAQQHILPERKPSPVERLAEKATAFTDNLSATNLQHLIETLGLELREKTP